MLRSFDGVPSPPKPFETVSLELHARTAFVVHFEAPCCFSQISPCCNVSYLQRNPRSSLAPFLLQAFPASTTSLSFFSRCWFAFHASVLSAAGDNIRCNNAVNIFDPPPPQQTSFMPETGFLARSRGDEGLQAVRSRSGQEALRRPARGGKAIRGPEGEGCP